MQSTKLRWLAPVAFLTLLSGCSEYVERREGISRTGGDAVRANIAVHVIDPWPPGAHDRRIIIDAERQTARTKAFNAGSTAPTRAETGAAAEGEPGAR